MKLTQSAGGFKTRTAGETVEEAVFDSKRDTESARADLTTLPPRNRATASTKTSGGYRETEGNPFFVEEVCKALIEDGKLYRENGHWNRVAMDQIHVPQGVRVAIESRLERLPGPAHEALRMAAVIGREFDFETLLRATEQDEDTLIDSLEQAQHAQLITEVNRSGKVSFAFVHALIPSALRDGISALRLQRMYRKTAAALEVVHPEDYEILAYQFGQGGEELPARKYEEEKISLNDYLVKAVALTLRDFAQLERSS